MTAPPIVRRIRSDEWRELRRLRLEALRDTPLAFGSTHERESTLDDGRWRRWAADADGRWAAMARGSVSRDEPSDGMRA